MLLTKERSVSYHMFLTNHIADRRARVLERHKGDVNSADMMDVRFLKMLRNMLFYFN